MDLLDNSVLKEIVNLGTSALFFVMWVFERKDRLKTQDDKNGIKEIAVRMEKRESEFVTIIKDNTSAIASNTKAIDELTHIVESLGPSNRMLDSSRKQ